jgi:tRNA threonylcarbamoyladenosine biosynthesis protein TsaE
MPKGLIKSRTFFTTSESATETLGMSIGRRIHQGACIALVGSLGTGKTVLVRGICRGLGVDEAVLSPTFVLFEEYRGRLPTVHLDFYRLAHEREIEELGVFDRLGDGSVILVEWADRSNRILAASDVVIRLEMTGDEGRRIVVEYPERFAGVFEDMDP